METLTDKGLRIDLPFSDLVQRSVISVTECHLTLFDTYICYKNVAIYTSSDNDENIPKEYKSNYRWTRPRSFLANVDMCYCDPEDKWLVGLEFSGIGSNPCWHFDTPKEALVVYNQLSNYLIKAI